MLTRLRTPARDEQGSVLVLVLVISFLLVGSLAIALTTSMANLTLSSRYGRSVQAMLASRSGIDAELAAMRNVSTYTSFPCTLTGNLSTPGAISSYAVTVQYTAASTALTCTGTGSTLGGSTAPTAATLTSTGTASHGAPTVMQANVSIAAGSTTLSAALGYAIFTSGNLDLLNAATIDQTGTNPAPNIYAGQTLTCANGTASQGSLTTYTPVTLSSACSFTGSLTADGLVTMQNSAHVGGAVIAYGAGITMTGNALITGNATATGGNISLSNSAAIDGNAYASGTISLSGGSQVKGTQNPGDSALSTQTMPSAVSFPAVDTTVSDWTTAGWNLVQIPNAVYTTCASYFQNIASEAGPGPPTDPFMTQLYTAATKTLVYAPTCNVTYSSSHTFGLNADVTLWVNTLTLSNSNTFESTSSTVHNFSVLASPSASCSTSSPTVDVNFSNFSSFTSTIDAFIYTQGAADYANAPAMNGQVLACSGFTGENGFDLNFVPAASAGLPWTGTTTTAPTLTVLDKLILKG